MRVRTNDWTRLAATMVSVRSDLRQIIPVLSRLAEAQPEAATALQCIARAAGKMTAALKNREYPRRTIEESLLEGRRRAEAELGLL